MNKLIYSLFLSIFIFAISLVPFTVFAQNPNAAPEVIDVYSVFWPVVPGKTVADSTFFLKQLKENFDGFFKSNPLQKSEFQLGLSEKRLVEAFKLIENKDFGNAGKSLGMSAAARREAVTQKRKALEQNMDATAYTPKIVKSLENQEKALKYMQTLLPEDQQAEIGQMINEITLQISEAK